MNLIKLERFWLSWSNFDQVEKGYFDITVLYVITVLGNATITMLNKGYFLGCPFRKNYFDITSLFWYFLKLGHPFDNNKNKGCPFDFGPRKTPQLIKFNYKFYVKPRFLSGGLSFCLLVWVRWRWLISESLWLEFLSCKTKWCFELPTQVASMLNQPQI